MQKHAMFAREFTGAQADSKRQPQRTLNSWPVRGFEIASRARRPVIGAASIAASLATARRWPH